MKNALITGGSSGMGLEYSRQLAAQGYSLTIVSNVQEQLDSAKAELEGLVPGVTVTTHWADLAADDSGSALHDWCEEQNLIPDVLVCNAGMFFFDELSTANLHKADLMLSLHVKANTDLCVLFGEEMKRRGSGQIIIMSSMAAKLPTPGITVYSATKAYLLSFGKSLWFEMKPYGVKVTTVCPAAVATPLYNLKPSLMKLGVRLGVIHTPQWLVRRALRASKRGKRVIHPSIMNAYLPALVAGLPAPVESRIWEKLKP
ncbi:MAG: SDR family NAD(P)-dependent oxidoreductase [Bacteroidia bacterium]|nr:SDR family NAD(P)-dependent oxidoreductase [Bacteroidia bacterium]